MRALTGLVYEVSQSYLELFWLFLTIGFQLQATCHLQGDGSVDCPYELLEDAWGGQSRAPSPPSSGPEIGPIRSGQNSPGPVTTGQRASRRAARSSRKRGVTLFQVSPNVAPGWGNTLVPVENTKPIPVPEPMLSIPGPTYASPLLALLRPVLLTCQETCLPTLMRHTWYGYVASCLLSGRKQPSSSTCIGWNQGRRFNKSWWFRRSRHPCPFVVPTFP